MTRRSTGEPTTLEQEKPDPMPPGYGDDPAIVDAWRLHLARQIRAMVCGPATECRRPRCRRSGLCAMRIEIFGVDKQAGQPVR